MPKIIDVPGQGRVEFPDSMTDPEIVAAIQRNSVPDATADMTRLEKFGAGAGKAFYDVGQGAGQLARGVVGDKLGDRLGLPTQESVDDLKDRSKALMNTGWGIGGNIAGGVAAFAPTAMIPGANTIGGGALIGALSGAVQPVGSDESRGQNAAIGGVAGAAVPALVRGAKVAKSALIDPFTDAGRQRIVGGTLNRAASDKALAQANMLSRQGATPDFLPTAGQSSDDAGIASIERAARAIDPAGFGDIDKSQRAALVNALRSVAKTPEDRAAAVEQVEKQAKRLYGEAFKESTPVTPTLSKLAKRPSMQKAEKRALSLADEMSMPYQARLKDMNPQTIPVPPRTAQPSVVLGPAERYNPYASIEPRPRPEISVPGEQIPGSGSFELPPVDSVPVRDMHTLKMGMDAMLSDPTQGIAKREAAAIMATRNKLLNELPESYQQARLGHIEMNKPVNQMDIGTELYKRFVPSLADGADVPFKATADSYAKALRNGDKLAKNVTGLKNAELEKIMDPDQMKLLQGVVSDSQMKATAENAGRGVGSDTVQKMAMSNMIAESGLPSWVQNLAPLRSVGGMAKTVGDILYTKNDETMRHLLADILKDPSKAAQAMQRAGVPPSKYAEVMKAAAQAGAVGTANSTTNAD